VATWPARTSASSAPVAAAPQWAPAHIELGSSLLDQERVPEALESFRTATQLDPKSVRGWNNLGVALQSLDRLDEALRAFDHTLTLNPNFALAHFNAARIHNLRYENKLALQHAQHAVRIDPKHVEAWLAGGRSPAPHARARRGARGPTRPPRGPRPTI